jgi:hypothetical protein
VTELIYTHQNEIFDPISCSYYFNIYPHLQEIACFTVLQNKGKIEAVCFIPCNFQISERWVKLRRFDCDSNRYFLPFCTTFFCLGSECSVLFSNFRHNLVFLIVIYFVNVTNFWINESATP